jgi:hypothetical protein
MPEISNDDGTGADLAGEFAHLLVRAPEELLQKAELVDDVERGG